MVSYGSLLITHFPLNPYIQNPYVFPQLRRKKSRPLPTPTVRAVDDHDADAQLIGLLVDEALTLVVDWWFMVIYADLWWFMVIYGDLMVV